jgi:hypothetical protein
MQNLPTKYNQLNFWLQDQIGHYFNNALSSFELIILLMSREYKIELEDEINIVEILVHYNTEWDKAPCNPDGPTNQQEKYIDKILESCSMDIIKLLMEIENNQ